RHVRLKQPSSKVARASTGIGDISVGAKEATPEGGAHEPRSTAQEADVEASKVARAPIGATDFDGVRPGRPGAHQASLCEPWRDIIVAKLEGGLTAQRIYQDLVSEHGFTGKYSSVR